MLLHAYGRPGAAAVLYRRARALQPRSARWAYLQGVAQAEAGDSRGAIESLRESLALGPDGGAPSLRLANLLLLDGRPSESREIYESVLQSEPSATARFGLGTIALSESDFAAAVSHLEAACALRPKFRQAHYALAQAYGALGEAAKAEAELARYKASEPNIRSFEDPWVDDVEGLRVGSFEYHFRAGRRHEEAGRLSQALEEYLRAAEIDPSAARVHVNLFAVYGRLHDLEPATAHYERALQLNPQIEELHYNYGVLLAGEGRFEAAATAFRKALAIRPGSAESHNNLAYALEQIGKTDEAVAEYEAAIAAKPNYPLPHIHLARRHFSAGRYRQAIPHLEAALPFERQQAAYLGFLLARAYAEIGKPEEAGQRAEAARRLAVAQGSAEVLQLLDRYFPPSS
jgi:tetratricopeptide (TPR) repeat protein